MDALLVPSKQLSVLRIAQRSTGAVDLLIEGLLVVLLLFLPLAYGAVEPWSEFAAMAVGALISLLLAVRICVRPREGIPWTRAFVPLLVYVGLIVAQLIVLPAGIVRLLSPGTASMKADLLSDLSGGAAGLRWMTLSFYPTATRHDLRIVALAITIFVAVLVVFQSPARIRRLLAAIAIIGGLLAVLALVQDFSGATGIYWGVPLGDLPWYGTFVAHAHFGQHMNLSLGAAIGLLIALPSRGGRLRKRDWFVRAGLVFVIAAGAAAVVLSRTRTGTLGLVAGGLLTIIVLVLRRGFNRNVIIGCAVTALLIAVPIFAGLDRISSRLATLQQPNEYFLRVTTNKDLLGVWKHFPLFGTGLGTHETFYPRFDTTMMGGLSTHAEDDYAEAAEETGLVGLGCAIAFALMIWHEWKVAALTRGPDICLAAAGLGLGFLAVQIQSSTDFGQHIPAVAVLTAVTCGLLINLRRIALPSQNAAHAGGWKSAGVLSIFAVAIFAVWAVCSSTSAALAEPFVTYSQDLADALNSQTGDSARGYADLIDNASKAVSADPDDIKHRYWLEVYRWRAVKQASTADDPATDPAARAAVSNIVDDLNQARWLCPTYGSAYSLMGQLEYYVLHSPGSSIHLQKAALLAPHEPACNFLAGLLNADDGKWDSAAGNFKLAYKFDTTRADDIIAVYVSHGRSDLAADVWGENYEWLTRVAELLPIKAEAAKARERAISLLRSICASETATGEELAQLASLYSAAGQDADAADCYQLALARAGDHADWHLARAEALRKLDRFEEARAEVYASLQLQPDQQQARDLLKLLSRDLGE